MRIGTDVGAAGSALLQSISKWERCGVTGYVLSQNIKWVGEVWYIVDARSVFSQLQSISDRGVGDTGSTLLQSHMECICS